MNGNPRLGGLIEPLENRMLMSGSVGVQPAHVDDATAEILARVTAYEPGVTAGATPVAGADYTVSRVFNNARDGFQAVGLISPTHAPVLALRGTDDAKDAKADANVTGVGFNQFSDNWLGKKGIKAWLDSAVTPTSTDAGGPADIVGHSLGGALAQWVAAAYTSQKHSIGEVVTFNSPGISAAYAKRFVASRSLSVTDYVASADIVSMAGQAFIAGQYRLAHFSDEMLLAPSVPSILIWEETKHTTPMLTNAGGTVPTDETIDASASTATLSSRSFVYKDPEYTEMIQDLTTAVSELPPPFHQLYSKIPSALKSRARTEASRPTIFKVLNSVLV